MNTEEPTSDFSSDQTETFNVRVIYNKTQYNVTIKSNSQISELKTQLFQLVGVPEKSQKLICRGRLTDEQYVFEAGLHENCKIMLIGSKPDDILSVTSNAKTATTEFDKDSSSTSKNEPLCQQKLHKKIIDKGVPDDVTPGILSLNEPIPTFPLSGMLNKWGGKIRLTFKLELDQVWLSTKDQTVKLPMNSIKSIVSEPIENFEQYHIMGLQLGATEASRYWVYWMPAQYVEAIKDLILGKWQLF